LARPDTMVDKGDRLIVLGPTAKVEVFAANVNHNRSAEVLGLSTHGPRSATRDGAKNPLDDIWRRISHDTEHWRDQSPP
jgi:hypothetical protein